MLEVRSCLLDIILGPLFGIFTANLAQIRETRIYVSLGRLSVIFVAQQRLDHTGCMLAKKVCVVASLLDDKHARTNPHQLSRHNVVLERTKLRPAKLIVYASVKTT